MWDCNSWSPVITSHPVSTCEGYVVVCSRRKNIYLYMLRSNARSTTSYCMWPLKLWYAAMYTINCMNYSLIVTSSKQVQDFKKESVYVYTNEWISVIYQYLKYWISFTFTCNIVAWFVFTFCKKITCINVCKAPEYFDCSCVL